MDNLENKFINTICISALLYKLIFQLHKLCNKMLRSLLSTYKWFFFSLIYITLLFLFSLYKQTAVSSNVRGLCNTRKKLFERVTFAFSISRIFSTIFAPISRKGILISKNLNFPANRTLLWVQIYLENEKRRKPWKIKCFWRCFQRR